MKISKLHGLGNHLVFDGYSEADLDSVKFVKSFIEKTVKEIGMRPISDTLVLYHEAEDPMESGVTGTIILAESNITIHTYPKKEWFCLDIFSCNEFDVYKTLNYVKKELKVKRFDYKLLVREPS